MDDESICPNAFFDPSVNMTYFCTNLSRYDVATHELGHALTSSLDNGLYEYASGALQESWSDIIAETFSQFWNGSGYYPPRNSNRSCVSSGDSKRWIVGDDCELFDNSLRDLYNPQCTGLPSTVSEMQCYPYDLNGVHTNCGPPSLAYALLADGGVFHGVSFTGIGLLKAWHIFFYAKYYYQLPSETFSDYATHLAQACRDIIGHPLKDQYGATAADIVSSTDCSTLSALLDAVGLDDQPCTTYTLWGAYPSYLPTTGSIVNILTAGCPTATEYLKIGTKTLDAQEYLFSQLGSTSGWNCLAEFNVPSYDRIGTSSPSSNVSFTVSADQAQTTKPVLDATYSLPQRIVYFSTPVISSVSPSSGDENGGYSVTLVGTGFQKFAGPCSPYIGTSYDCLICFWYKDLTHYYADFGTYVDSKHISCVAPAAKGTWQVSVTLNAQDLAYPTTFQFVAASSDGTGGWFTTKHVIWLCSCVAVLVVIVVAVVLSYVIYTTCKKRGFTLVPSSQWQSLQMSSATAATS
eukprot:TRINITY_DN1693_c0_g1_i2.p1 TRINITY_DN1693_c0_g1~~TRINITY_DN1693_c0_g1_i2.p1  ORF type:complete len:520 (-),score=106.99 TRINITY_DN1693_c0_g1_i2:59-1618(-)